MSKFCGKDITAANQPLCRLRYVVKRNLVAGCNLLCRGVFAFINGEKNQYSECVIGKGIDNK